MMFQNILNLFTRTFWHPFTNPRRAIVLVGSFFGMVGFGMMTFIASYDLAGQSAAALEIFLCLRVGGIALLSVFFYLSFSMFDGILYRAVLLALIVASFALYLTATDTPLLRGMIAGFLSALYWGSLHIAMTHNSSDENRGHEVAVMGVMWMSGAVAASALGAWFLEHDLVDYGIATSIATLMAATLCMLATSRIMPLKTFSHYVFEAKAVWLANHGFIKRTAVFALFESSGHIMAAYQSLLGYTPGTAATLLICRVVIEFAFAPLIGKLASQFSHHNFRHGLMFIGIGWLGLAAFAQNELAFIAFILIGSFGLRVMSAGINVQMYAIKSYSAMMWSELALGLGRIAGILVMVPLLYYAPFAYALAFAILALIVYIVRALMARKEVTADA